MGLISKVADKLHHKDKETDPTTTTSNTSTSVEDHNTTASVPDTGNTIASGSGSHGLSTNNYGATPSSSGYGTTGTSTTSHVPSSNTTTTAGMANKARIDSENNSHDFMTGTGPHSSSTANRTDPLVHDSTTSHGRHNEHNTTSGPHASNMANRADPLVDSENSRLGGVSGSHGQFADTVSGSSHGAGYGSTHTAPLGASSGTAGHTNTTSTTHAPLNSSGPGPYGTKEDYGPTGPASHTLGPHSSNASNIADPRVHPEPEKMKDHKTVGPHKSDMLNKLDPRVDSDPRHHGYADRDPTHAHSHSHNDNSRFDSNALDHSGKQTGGFVGGPQERLENRGSIPTAGGLPVGDHGNGPYSDSSRSTGLTGSHSGVTGSHGGLTGSHVNEPYGATHSTTSGPHPSNMANKADPLVDSDNSRFASTGHGPATGSGIPGSHTAGIPGSTSSHHAGSGLTGSHASSGIPGTTSHHTSSGIPGTHSNTTGSSDLEFKERELGLRQRELELKEREMEQGMRRL